jgi:hypothetical protein
MRTEGRGTGGTKGRRGAICGALLAVGAAAQGGGCPGAWFEGAGAIDVVNDNPNGAPFVADFVRYAAPGSSPKLVVAGSFTGVGAPPGGVATAASYVAAWNGAGWEALGEGLPGPVTALAVFNGTLYAAGAWQVVIETGSPWEWLIEPRFLAWLDDALLGGAPPTAPVWRLVDAPSQATVHDMTVMNGKLWLGGNFGPFTYQGAYVAGGQVLSFGGGGFQTLPWTFLTTPGGPARVFALEPWDRDGNGPRPTELIVGGRFGGVVVDGTAIPGTAGVVRRDGVTGAPFSLAGGITLPSGAIEPENPELLSLWAGGVSSLASVPNGTTPRLFVGGRFDFVGTNAVAASNIAYLTGPVVTWHSTGPGGGGPGANGLSDQVLSMCAYFDGCGSVLAVGGNFVYAGGVAANGLALFDGATWSPLAGGFGADVSVGSEHPHRMIMFESDLWIGGGFEGVFGPTSFVPSVSLARWQ